MPSATIQRIQQALKEQGFNPGDLDSVWGRVTIGAVRRFQAHAGLEVDGVIGPRTLAALFPAGTPPADPAGPADAGLPPLVWYQEAIHLVGTAEAAGKPSNPVIVEWARDLDIDYPSDDVAWCGLFVAHCIGATLPDEPLPAGPLGAQNWRRFGDRCDPMLGAVLVFWRGKPDSGLGHVGFYRAEDKEAYHVLGGNQSDKVNVARVPKQRFLDARWPHSARSIKSVRVYGEPAAPLSVKEG